MKKTRVRIYRLYREWRVNPDGATDGEEVISSAIRQTTKYAFLLLQHIQGQSRKMRTSHTDNSQFSHRHSNIYVYGSVDGSRSLPQSLIEYFDWRKECYYDLFYYIVSSSSSRQPRHWSYYFTEHEAALTALYSTASPCHTQQRT